MAEAFFGFLGGLLAGCLLAALDLWRRHRRPPVDHGPFLRRFLARAREADEVMDYRGGASYEKPWRRK